MPILNCSVSTLEIEALQSGEAFYNGLDRTLRVRGYRSIKGSNVLCDYTLSGININRGDAISFLATGKTIAERAAS